MDQVEISQFDRVRGHTQGQTQKHSSRIPTTDCRHGEGVIWTGGQSATHPVSTLSRAGDSGPKERSMH